MIEVTRKGYPQHVVTVKDIVRLARDGQTAGNS
jgi:hypothetical protein